MAFYINVGPKPAPEFSLDRIDGNKGYEPGNVRWATPSEQWENRKQINMTFAHYQHETSSTAIYPDDTQFDALVYCTLGLSSEASEVCGKVKKVMRDGGFELSSSVKNDIISEMGDVLWYLSELASVLDVSLEVVATRNLNKLADRKDRDVLRGSGANR